MVLNFLHSNPLGFLKWYMKSKHDILESIKHLMKKNTKKF